MRGPGDVDEAGERRRKGREYLARRNQQMYELQQRKNRKGTVLDTFDLDAFLGTKETDATHLTAMADQRAPKELALPSLFDALLDAEGMLKITADDLPNPRDADPRTELASLNVPSEAAHEQLPESLDTSGFTPDQLQLYRRQQYNLGLTRYEQEHSKEIDALYASEGETEVEDPPIQVLSPRPFTPELVPSQPKGKMRELVQTRSNAAPPAAGVSAFDLGARYADPFGDEYGMESATPKQAPAIPPKVALQDEPEFQPERLTLADSFPYPSSTHRAETETTWPADELTYEEQLAIALSLSEQDTLQANAVTVRDRQPGTQALLSAATQQLQTVVGDEHDEDEANLRKAIAASLQDTMVGESSAPAPLVDLTPLVPDPEISVPPVATGARSRRESDWEALFDSEHPSSHTTSQAAFDPPESVGTDELYHLTPQLTRARLASHDQAIRQSVHDPVREAAATGSAAVITSGGQQTPQKDASFYSAASSAVGAPRTMAETSGFGTESSIASETFASMSASTSALEGGEDSVVDVESLSDDGSGVNTPDSWTEVGSRDGESE